MADPQRIIHLIGTLDQFDASYKLRVVAGDQAASGAEVTVVAFSATREARELTTGVGVKCEIIYKRWQYDPFAGRQLFQILRDLGAAMVFLWDRRATDSAPTVRRALPEARLIATLTEVPQLANPWWPNTSLQAVDAIVVERETTRQEFIDAGQGEEKVHVVTPGVAQAATAPERRAVLSQLGLSNDARIVAMAGPLERWQLADEAIWCFELIRILHDGVFLVIVGDGAERTKLERFTRQVTDPEVVRFVTQAALLDDVLNCSEIYWQPGHSENIPIALLNAMSKRLPVVASDTSAHRSVIEPDVSGLLVTPAKRPVWARCTDQLLKDGERRAKLGAAARQSVEKNHSLAAMIEGYKVLVQRAAGLVPAG